MNSLTIGTTREEPAHRCLFMSIFLSAQLSPESRAHLCNLSPTVSLFTEVYPFNRLISSHILRIKLKSSFSINNQIAYIENIVLTDTSISYNLHSSIFYDRLIRRSVRGGGWSLSQQSYPSSGERRGTPWTGRQFITGPHSDK